MVFDNDINRLNDKTRKIDQIIQEFFAGIYGEPEVALANIGEILEENVFEPYAEPEPPEGCDGLCRLECEAYRPAHPYCLAQMT